MGTEEGNQEVTAVPVEVGIVEGIAVDIADIPASLAG